MKKNNKTLILWGLAVAAGIWLLNKKAATPPPVHSEPLPPTPVNE